MKEKKPSKVETYCNRCRKQIAPKHNGPARCELHGDSCLVVVWICARAGDEPPDPKKRVEEKITSKTLRFVKNRNLQKNRDGAWVIVFSIYWCVPDRPLAEILGEQTGLKWTSAGIFMDTAHLYTFDEPPEELEIVIPWSETKIHYE